MKVFATRLATVAAVTAAATICIGSRTASTQPAAERQVLPSDAAPQETLPTAIPEATTSSTSPAPTTSTPPANPSAVTATKEKGPAGPQPATRSPASPSAPAILRLAPGVEPAAIVAMSHDSQTQHLLTLAKDHTLAEYHSTDGTRISAFRLPPTPSPIAGTPSLATAQGRVRFATSMGGSQVFVFEPENPSPLQQLKYDKPVTAIALSADGSMLAVGLGGNGGVRTYRWQDQRYVRHSAAAVANDGVNALAILPSDELAVSHANGEVRLYSQELALRVSRRLDQAPGALAITSGDPTLLAVGGQDTPRVEVFDIALSPTAIHVADPQGVIAFPRVCWVGPAGNQQLVAAGSSKNHDHSGLFGWTAEGDARHFGPTASEIGRVTALTPLPSGDMVIATDRGLLRRLDRYGNEVWRVAREVPDFRPQSQNLALSWNGRRVRFTSGEDSTTVVYPPAGKAGGGKFFVARQSGLPLENWKDSPHPTLDGKRLPLERGEVAYAVAVNSDAGSFAIGTDRALRMYNAAGTELWHRSLPSAVRALNISRNDRLVVAGLDDGQLSWFQHSDGSPVLSLLHHGAGNGHVAWTPEGFFDDSGEGGAMIGYEIDRGTTQSTAFVRIDQLRDRYHRPELVMRSLHPSRGTVVDAASKLDDPRMTVGQRLPPEIELVSSETHGGELFLRYKLQDQGGGIGDVRIRLDERLVAPTRTRAPAPSAPQGEAIFEQAISLHPGDNLVSLVVENQAGDLRSSPVQLNAINTEAVIGSRNLHILTIGISNYDDPYLRKSVRWARDDAQSLGKLMSGGEGELFSEVAVTGVLDASLKDIETAFSKMREQVEPQDTFVLYLAGHGIARNGRYHFLPRELVELDDESLDRGSLHEERLVSMLSQIRAERSLVLLDTCSAGAALPGREIELKAAIDRLHRESGQVFIAASGDSQKALELPESHSAFALVLMQALQGQANRGNDSLIDVDELGDYVLDHLPQLTRDQFGYEQRPIRKGDARFPISSTSIDDGAEP